MPNEQVHEVLYSEAALTLGEIHWMILKATETMDSKRWNSANAGFGKTYEATEFGKEVGMDEIHWWIFKKEPDVDELGVRTEDALNAGQALQVASVKLKRQEPKTYEELLLILRNLADSHHAEIETLRGYVTWLAARNPMAPRILFTYRIWGSTRMSDRTVDIGAAETPRSDMDKLRTITEIVLGVSQRGWRQYERVRGELSYEMCENMNWEELREEGDYVPEVPEGRVVSRAANEIFDNCAIYFTELRQSLRNIVLDARKMKEQYQLFNSDKFWREFIPKAAKAKKVETQLWDFKETLTAWHVKTEDERRKAKVTFAEDVASFANSSGGVLIVGVSDKREIVGVGDGKDLENRLKVARDVLATHIKYDNELASFKQVAIGEEGKEKVCLVVVISKAYKAVGVRHEDGKFSYPVRRETGIARVAVDDLSSRIHEKSDSRDFMTELEQFVREN
jgi:hypothetical protein